MNTAETKICDKHPLRRATASVQTPTGGTINMCAECVEHGFKGQHLSEEARTGQEMPPIMLGLIDPNIESAFMNAICVTRFPDLKADCSAFTNTLSNSQPMIDLISSAMIHMGCNPANPCAIGPLYHMLLAAYKAGTVGALDAMFKL